jgi:hypothetical protein
MNISWVISDGYQVDPAIDITAIKNIGPIWGSWTTWRACSTDNVICHNQTKAQDLVKRNFQNSCNFYLPEKYYQAVGRPTGIKYYQGDFAEEMNSIEDIVSLHLACASSNIVLMLGFNFSPIQDPGNKFELHKIRNYYGLSRSLVSTNADVQWVLLDHTEELDKSFKDLTNLTCDNLENVLQLLAQ